MYREKYADVYYGIARWFYVSRCKRDQKITNAQHPRERFTNSIFIYLQSVLKH